MDIRFPRLLLLAAVLLASSCTAPSSASLFVPARKKLIATGWDSPNAAMFREHLAEFEKYPFDGTVIRPTRATGEGKSMAANYAFGKEHWTEEEFAQTVFDLRAAVPVTAKENFLLINANPGDVDWFDDAGWAEIVDHWRILAKVARAGRLKGIAFDPEPYTEPFRPFSYTVLAARGYSFAEYKTKVRQRGQEVMSAVIKEYPAITILCYRLLSDVRWMTQTPGDLDLKLGANVFGLLPAFLDGWLDVSSGAMRLVDGNESAYRYNSEAEFSRAYLELRQNVQLLVTESNRPKLKRSLRVGQPIYLDAYCNPPTDSWYINPMGGTPAQRLETNLTAALRASDEYVWVYGEKGRWWPGGLKYPGWPEKFSGVEGALRQAKAAANRP